MAGSSRPPVAFITDRPTAHKAVAEAYKHSPVSIDTEFNPDDGSIETLQYSWGRGVRVVVLRDLLDIFADWIVDPKILKVYQNYKADRESLVGLGFDGDELDQSFHADIMVETAIHDPNDRIHDLKHQSKKYLGWPRLAYKKRFCYTPPGRKNPIVLTPRQLLWGDGMPPDALAVKSQAEWTQDFLDYGGDDAESTILCHFKHKAYLQSIGYWESYLEIDRLYTLTLIRMQARGIRINKPLLEKIRALVTARKMRAGYQFRRIAGKPDFNFDSAPQKKALYFDELKWPTRDDFLSDTGLQKMRYAVTEEQREEIRKKYPSCDEEAMTWYYEETGHPLARLHIKHQKARTLETTITGILDGLDAETVDGKRIYVIRTDLNQVGGQLTGRISSRKINVEVEETYYTPKKRIEKTRIVKKKVGMQLQNMPSKKEKDPFGIRRAFIARPGRKLIVADYSGFELMMALFWAAKYTPHSKMLDIMRHHGSPSAIHAYTAIEMMNLGACGLDQVKKKHPDEYLYSKNCNFLLIYGGTWKRLCQQLMQAGVKPALCQRCRRVHNWDWRIKCNKFKAREMIERWNDLYPEIQVMQRELVIHGYTHGWVPTVAGRRLPVAEGLAHPDEGIRGHWERKCINGPCQGSAADIVKDAQNRIEYDEQLNEWGNEQLLQVHDEIINEAIEEYADDANERIVYLMKQPYASVFPFEIAVEGKTAYNWLEAK